MSKFPFHSLVFILINNLATGELENFIPSLRMHILHILRIRIHSVLLLRIGGRIKKYFKSIPCLVMDIARSKCLCYDYKYMYIILIEFLYSYCLAFRLILFLVLLFLLIYLFLTNLLKLK